MEVRAFSDRLRLLDSQRDLRGVAFFVLVPLALAILTATETGYNRALGYGGAVLYVSLLALIPWWIAEAATRVVWICLRDRRPPLWLVSSLGALAACVFVAPYVSGITTLFETYWPIRDPAAIRGGGPNDLWVEGLVHSARAVFFWTAANYVFDRLLGYPRFRNEGATSGAAQASPASAPSAEQGVSGGLLERLSRIGALSEISFVKAEAHYVRVHSAAGEEFVTYRFGAALKDLEGENGFQVHRSYWVRRSEVVSLREDGSRLTLEMSDGSLVPVSRPYHALVRQVL